MQDKFTCYNEHFYSTKPSTIHQSRATPHSNRVVNPRSKLDISTLTSLDTIGNTQHPNTLTIDSTLRQ